MGMTRIKLTDKAKMALFMELSNSIITLDNGILYVSTPEETGMYDTVSDLMEDINYNLKVMHEMYEASGELDEWNEAKERADAGVRDWRL